MRFAALGRVGRALVHGMVLLLACGLAPAAESILDNGGFEEAVPAPERFLLPQPGKSWRVKAGTDGNAVVPAEWTLNGGYPGELVVVAEDAGQGRRCVRVRADEDTDAHIYQLRKNVVPGQCYRVSLLLRDGSANVFVYQYFTGKRIETQYVGASSAPESTWRRFTGYYTAPDTDLLHVALAIAVPRGGSVLLDEAAMTPADAPESIVLENDVTRLVLSVEGTVEALVDKASGRDYTHPDNKITLFAAQRGKIRLPTTSVERSGDLLRLEFADPQVSAAVRVTRRSRYFLFEVTDAQPTDLDSLRLALVLKPLAVKAGVIGATYDQTFGISITPVTPNTIPWVLAPQDTFQTRAVWFRRYGGIQGGVCALIATPFDELLPTLRQVEQDTPLPCPVLDGEWARDSEPARRSYLFVTSYQHGDLDELIRYAKIGGFDLILFNMSTVFRDHGHYEIIERHFPDGLQGLREVVEAIHAAGLRAGIHMFGPSVSFSDPYVQPQPDPRLLSSPCPPLADAVDAEATQLTLAAATDDLPAPGADVHPHHGCFIRIGDEIVQHNGVAPGPPFRLLDCRRGACGTKAAAHPAGSTVQRLYQLGEPYPFFLADPDTSILEEMSRNLGRVVNTCKLDMVYVDGSAGPSADFRHRLYYLQKWHLAFYRAFDHDVLYQTSFGTGHGILWHLTSRGASADGHGDLKWYLDQRLDTILRMRQSFTPKDIGWYGLDMDRTPDQLEYVASKCLAVDGSISVQASLRSLNEHPRAREIMEMLGRYERCRLSGHFPEAVKTRLLQKAQDFRLVEDGQGLWQLSRAWYGEERLVEAIDGRANVWTVPGHGDQPCTAAVEIQRRARQPATAGDYDRFAGPVLAAFSDLSVYASSDRNRYAEFVVGPDRDVTPERTTATLAAGGPVQHGVSQVLTAAAGGSRSNGPCAVYTADNTGKHSGWCGRGKRFESPLDLSQAKALGLWVHGDGKGETFFFQLHDANGQIASYYVPVTFSGWRFHAFLPGEFKAFDWEHVEYLVLYLIKLPRDTKVTVKLEPIKALTATTDGAPVQGLELVVGSRRFAFPVALGPNQCITFDGLGTCLFWPGGMAPAQPLDVGAAHLVLDPGENRVSFTVAAPEAYPGDTSVRFCRIRPLE